MPIVELIVALLLAASLLAGLARLTGVHYAVVLVLGGLALASIPGLPTPAIRPSEIFFVFIPPLTYAAAFTSSTQDLRAQARPIALLAIGLVLATIAVAAAAAHVVVGMAWGPALLLGAVLGPTDPVAATSVLRRLGAPDRISTILEGESLVNDGTGLTVYNLVVLAVVSGSFSLASGAAHLILALGGVLIGLVAGWVSAQVRKRIDEPTIEISVSLLTAYLAYIPADRIGSSGILATVAAGLYVGRSSPSVLSPTSRLQTVGFWEVITFLLESVLFLMIGLELRHIVAHLQGSALVPLLGAAALLVASVAVRMAWMFVVPALLHVLDLRNARGRPVAAHAEQFVLGWAGMRGAVSLAAALAIPLTANGHPFPGRDTVIFIAYVTIVATLVLPGLTLPRLICRLGVGEQEEVARAEARARVALAHAALRRLEAEADYERLDEAALSQLRAHYEWRIQRLEPEIEDGAGDPEEIDTAWQVRRLQRELIGVERNRLRELRRRGAISAESSRRIQHDLDLEESRLSA